MSSVCQVLITAISKKEAEQISKTLLKQRLIAGYLIIKGDSGYWWKNKLASKQYYNVQAFCLVNHKTRIIKLVQRLSSDQCPIIAFFKLDGNKDFLDWVKQSSK
ncbi:MAG: divalent cation tolerance protein CutA [Candidatus Diapherotrites archaeon]|nr:divalent cation tolerance protein CutA [Candidatus Diapherotrites archaeon]